VGNDNGNQRSFFRLVGRYTQLAFTLPLCTLVGWLAGSAVDRWLHTTWLYLAGIILGIAAGFVDLVRTVMSDTK
jgi:F0F1-type ATP synthase assembly protein I